MKIYDTIRTSDNEEFVSELNRCSKSGWILENTNIFDNGEEEYYIALISKEI